MTAAFADDDLFHVLVSDDDMKRMNVDQLADAFRLSVIDASTLVWQTGMNGWRRLGSIADVEPEEEELETAVLWAAPPPPPPIAPPPRRTAASFQTTSPYRAPVQRAPVYQAPAYPAPAYPAPAPPESPASYFEQPAYPAVSGYPEPDPYYAPASYPGMAEPRAQAELLAPVYSPAMPEPDPYVLPKRRVDIPETIDFRRAPGSIRWGRWFVALLVMTGGVVGAYRQNLLRDGARRIGIEGAYLAAEQRATAFVGANASSGVKRTLESLALLPGPNALPDATAERTPPASKPAAAAITLGAAPVVAAPPCVAQPAEPKALEANSAPEPAVKTVSLNALPLLGKASSARAQPEKREEEVGPRPSKSAARKAERERAREVESEAEAAPRVSKKKKKKRKHVEDVAEAAEEPVAKAEPKAKKPKAEALPPPPTDGNPLKAAMWSAVASDTKKLAARKRD